MRQAKWNTGQLSWIKKISFFEFVVLEKKEADTTTLVAEITAIPRLAAL
jgi:hypothetical protein